MIEPELVNLYGTLYEKVPAFLRHDGSLHPAFREEGGTVDAFYVRQPLLLSACRLRNATRLIPGDIDPALFRDFDSRHRLLTPEQVDAYSAYLEGDFLERC